MISIRGRVMVTGAAGFIGAGLTRELLRDGAEVHAFVRRTTDLWRLADVLPRIELHYVDLRDLDDLKANPIGYVAAPPIPPTGEYVTNRYPPPCWWVHRQEAEGDTYRLIRDFPDDRLKTKSHDYFP